MIKKEIYIKIVLIFSLLLLLITSIFIGYKNFSYHRDTIIKQQQEHLLSISKSISKSIDDYLKYNSYSLSLMSENPIIKKLLKNDTPIEEYNVNEDLIKSFFTKHMDNVESVSLLNKDGKIIYHYPKSVGLEETRINNYITNNIIKDNQPFFTKEYPSGFQKFSMDIVQPIMINNELKGILVSTISLNKLYENLIKPIKAGKKGYTLIKNREGIILMHPVSNQIGIESIKVRSEKFPELDWSELKALNTKQLEEKEGYYTYHSRWWQENEIQLVKKITAFTTFETQNLSWIISVQMDYSEIESPIKGTLINILTLTIIIMIFLIMVFYIIFKIEKRRKALEIETKYLKELNKTWDKLIKSEARLRHTQKLETIGLLTSGIAHELKNLLCPIIGYSELLLYDIKDNEDLVDNVMEVKKSALRSKELIDQILSFSRKDKLMDKPKLINVEDIIKESIKLIKSIQPKNIKIELNIKYNARVLAHKTQLEQVLVNLYTNAYYAMKSRGGTLQINVDLSSAKENKYYQLKEEKYVKIQIKDSGIGMNKETLSKIFDPFFTTKKAEEGTGLGLSVVQGIIKEHNGNIIINSRENIGTTINIYLPVYENSVYNNVKI